jgi:hypothetical protein
MRYLVPEIIDSLPAKMVNAIFAIVGEPWTIALHHPGDLNRPNRLGAEQPFSFDPASARSPRKSWKDD